MSFVFSEEFVLFDLEYAAWEDSQERNWSGPNEYREIIQIGAIRVSSDLVEQNSFLAYVRPVKNPKLSDFIIGLTGISQDDIEQKGIAYPDAFQEFTRFVGDIHAYCWGKDIEVIKENNMLTGVSATLSPDQYENLRPMMAADFSEIDVDVAKYSSGTLISAFGADSGRRAHDAVNDMRNLLDAIRELGSQKGSLPNE